MTFFTKLYPWLGVWCPWTCSGAPEHGNQNELSSQNGSLGQEHTSLFLAQFFFLLTLFLCYLKQCLVFWSPWDSQGPVNVMEMDIMNVMISSLQRQLKPLHQSFCHPQYLCSLDTQHSSFGLFSLSQSPEHYFNPWPAGGPGWVWSPLSYFQQMTSLKCRIRLHSTTLTEWSQGCYYM